MSTSRKLPAWRGARARRARRGRGRPWRRGERRAAARGGWRRCPCPRRGTPGTPTARASRPPRPAPCGRRSPPPPSAQLLQPPRKATTPGPDGTRRRRPGSRGRSPPSRRSVVEDGVASRDISRRFFRFLALCPSLLSSWSSTRKKIIGSGPL
jgi:hypothetical protein